MQSPAGHSLRNTIGHGARALRRRIGFVAAACLLACTPLAQAQPYPSKPIWIIVSFGAGGAVDIVARTVAQELAPRLGQPVLVENRVGAGGNVGATAVAKARADGYMLLMGANNNTVAHKFFANLAYDPVKDLTPVALIASAPAVLLVSASLPVKDVAGLVAMAKAKPGALTYGHGGVGTTTEHLAAELLLGRAGISMISVPYKGGAPAMQDLMGNQTTMMFTNLLNAIPHIRSGRLRALAIAAAERAPAIPDVPTMAESGYPDFNAAAWWGLMGPAGMPAEVVNRLNREVGEVLASPSMKERLDALTAQPMKRTPEQFAAFYMNEIRKWDEVVTRAGIKAQ